MSVRSRCEVLTLHLCAVSPQARQQSEEKTLQLSNPRHPREGCPDGHTLNAQFRPQKTGDGAQLRPNLAVADFMAARNGLLPDRPQ